MYSGFGESTLPNCSNRKMKEDEKKRKCKVQNKKKKCKKIDWTVVVTEVVDSVENSNINTKSVETPDKSVSKREEDQDSAFESDEERDNSDIEDVKSNDQSSCHTRKSAITTFLPPKYLLRSWSDDGRKLSPKSRKVYHDSIDKDEETISVGDCAVFLSTGRPDRPYIGRIDSMWQTTAGTMRVQVMWFYHPAEVEGTAVGGGRVEDIKNVGALFSSNHYDENDVQTISHKCRVVQPAEFTSQVSNSTGLDLESNDLYFLAGEYDPVEGTIVFEQ